MTTYPTLLEKLLDQGKPPPAWRVVIDEVFLHCAKTLMHFNLWDSDRHMARPEFPLLGHMIAEQIGSDDCAGAEVMVQYSVKTNFISRCRADPT